MNIHVDEFKKDILDAIQFINIASENTNCFSYITTIRSFLLGKSCDELKMVFQESISYGTYSVINKNELEKTLTELVNEKRLSFEVVRGKKKYFCLNGSLDPFYSKIINPHILCKYSTKDFEKLAKWNEVTSMHKDIKNGKRIEFNDRYLYYDSNYEKIIIKMLIDNSNVIDIGTQALNIGYLNKNGKREKYYPDIVFLNSEGIITIVEVKSTHMMSNYINMQKYASLKNYCEERGFRYIEYDPNSQMSYVDLELMKPHDDIFCEINIWVENNENNKSSLLKMTDLKWLRTNLKMTTKEFDIHVAATVVQCGLVNAGNKGIMIKPLYLNNL